MAGGTDWGWNRPSRGISLRKSTVVTRIHLVRHGRPVVSGLPRDEWPLDPAYDGDIGRLRRTEVLPASASWFTSPERRAVQTAELLGHPEATVVDDLREQDRPNGLVDDLVSVVAQALAVPDQSPLPGWESARSMTDRLVAAVRPLMERADPLVLVGHGFALSLLVAHLTGSPPDLAVWRALLMPDHCAIEDGAVVSAWSQWTSVS